LSAVIQFVQVAGIVSVQYRLVAILRCPHDTVARPVR
jgi:hypothetical protein